MTSVRPFLFDDKVDMTTLRPPEARCAERGCDACARRRARSAAAAQDPPRSSPRGPRQAPGPCSRLLRSDQQPTRRSECHVKKLLEPRPGTEQRQPAKGKRLPAAGGGRPRGERKMLSPARWLPLRDDLHDIRVNQFGENESRRHRACPISGNGVPDGFPRPLSFPQTHRPSGVRRGGGAFHASARGCLALLLWE